jgi:hypothetical protein
MSRVRKQQYVEKTIRDLSMENLKLKDDIIRLSKQFQANSEVIVNLHSTLARCVRQHGNHIVAVPTADPSVDTRAQTPGAPGEDVPVSL